VRRLYHWRVPQWDSMNVEHTGVCFLFFWMEGETVWYLIDIEVDHFSERDESVQKAALEDAVVMVDTEDGDENIDNIPVFFLLGASLT
jgi:hypothetical protein